MQAQSSRRRSLAKTVTWRVTGTLDTLILSWIITGSATFAGAIALSEVGTKMLLYFFHERAWAHVSWGATVPRPTGEAAPPQAAPELADGAEAR